MKTKIILTASICVLILGLSIGGTYYWNEFNSFEAKHESVTIELGTEVSDNPSDYIEAREAILVATEIDKSNIDIHTANTYKLLASWKKETVEIDIIVEDTISPVITLKEREEESILVNTKLSAMDFIESIDDQAGIKSVKFEADQVEITEADSLEAVFKFDVAGVQEVKVFAEDMSGNVSEASFSMKVIEDYLAHVEGVVDITTEQGITPDWLSGITMSDKIIEIIADDAEVDINTPGEYTLKYYINGDDNETVVTEKVIVKVEKPKPAPTPTVTVAKQDRTNETTSKESKPKKTTQNNTSTAETESKSDKDAQARAVAKEIVASIPNGTDLERITAASEAVLKYKNQGVYIDTGSNYNIPYGVFIAGEYSFAGTTRALGLVLELMGYQWEHKNPNQWTHQWVVVKNMDGEVGWADGYVGLADYGDYPYEGMDYIIISNP